VAALLREMATLLEAQGGNPFRAAAYRRAAETVAGLEGSLRERFEREGVEGLDALPGIGPSIAAAIAEMLAHGRWGRLEHLRGDADAEALFRGIPGVGPALARQLHEDLGVATLEALEAAAWDGRLAQLPRLGARRAAALRAALTERLDRVRSLRRARAASAPLPGAGRAPVPGAAGPTGPPVALLLDVDREYRAGAEAGTLPTLAPRRFNPEAKPWLPVLHTQRGDWHCTALFSNTARAHELGRTHDWVVIHAEGADHVDHQFTVVTQRGGPLAGRRVVRGREAECRALAASAPTAPSQP
jgi:predicted flap endonuclease-1-like 5' DNA nuclease